VLGLLGVKGVWHEGGGGENVARYVAVTFCYLF